MKKTKTKPQINPHPRPMELVKNPIGKGTIRIYRKDTGETLYHEDNVITDISRWLFATFMATQSPISLSPPQLQPLSVAAVPPGWGIWGLALGAGSPAWAPTTQPTETAQQVEIIQPLARVQLSRINFVTQDAQGNWNSVTTLSTNVEFQTTVNSTTNNIAQGIREIGLIGGGTATTLMASAPFFNGNPTYYATVAAAQNTVILVNYKVFPPLLLPPGIDIIFSWIFSM